VSPIRAAGAAELVLGPRDRDEEPIHDECAICGEEAVETAYFAKTY
jgi:prolyl-tRNA synthetase